MFEWLAHAVRQIIPGGKLPKSPKVGGHALGSNVKVRNYIWDFRKEMPKHYAAYLAVLPTDLHRVPWIARTDATGTPIECVTIRGRAYFASEIRRSRPGDHDALTFLVKADGSRAVGLLNSAETGGEFVEFGEPSAAEREFLIKEVHDPVGPSPRRNAPMSSPR